MSIVYLNGEFIAEQDAKISVFDRGFLFADSIYDVIPVYKNHFIGLEAHLKRLQESLQAIDVAMPVSTVELTRIFTELLQRNALQEEDLSIYLQITRGVQVPRSYLVNEVLAPTLFISCSAANKRSEAELMQGLTAITLADKRRQDCYIKSTSLLPSVIAANQAKKAGVNEALLVYNDQVLESSSGNLFIVNPAGEIITPPRQAHILAGVTRDIVLEIATQHHFLTQETSIKINDLMQAQEVWVTGSIKGICPIVSINGNPVNGRHSPGKVWQQFYHYYQDYKESHLRQEIG